MLKGGQGLGTLSTFEVPCVLKRENIRGSGRIQKKNRKMNNVKTYKTVIKNVEMNTFSIQNTVQCKCTFRKIVENYCYDQCGTIMGSKFKAV